ncbi:MAG: ClpXP protease specificity-enhancing factor [Betaproteobacteria bacterium]|jgi:stringent starvation protein B
MPSIMSPDAQGTSTRPYLVRALHDWCTDNGFTPYLAVFVDGSVQVPMEYVKNQEIVLNVGFDATSGLQLGNEFIEFKARFGGVARDIVVPIGHVVAIYARENGQGMAFPAPKMETTPPEGHQPEAPAAQGADQAAAGPRPMAAVIALAKPEAARPATAASDAPSGADDPNKPPTGGRPTLKRVK